MGKTAVQAVRIGQGLFAHFTGEGYRITNSAEPENDAALTFAEIKYGVNGYVLNRVAEDILNIRELQTIGAFLEHLEFNNGVAEDFEEPSCELTVEYQLANDCVTSRDKTLDKLATLCGGERVSSGFAVQTGHRDIQYFFETAEDANNFTREVQKLPGHAVYSEIYPPADSEQEREGIKKFIAENREEVDAHLMQELHKLDVAAGTNFNEATLKAIADLSVELAAHTTDCEECRTLGFSDSKCSTLAQIKGRADELAKQTVPRAN